MKKFILNSLIFLLFAVLFVEVASMLLQSTKLHLFNLPGQEIYHAITKSKKKSKSKKLLLGDSVGYQLFPNEDHNGKINSLACNQSIGMIGQYFLLNNYLKAKNEIDTVFMLFTPFTFKNNLDQIFTFHYFLKPFYNSEYTPMFSETTKQQISKIPYYQFARLPHIRIGSWSPNYKPEAKTGYNFFSPISIEYLKKIKELAVKHDFKLVFVATPTSLKKKDKLKDLNVNEYKECNLDEELTAFYQNIRFLDDKNFKDGTHLKKPEVYTKLYLKEVLN